MVRGFLTAFVIAGTRVYLLVTGRKQRFENTKDKRDGEDEADLFPVVDDGMSERLTIVSLSPPYSFAPGSRRGGYFDSMVDFGIPMVPGDDPNDSDMTDEFTAIELVSESSQSSLEREDQKQKGFDSIKRLVRLFSVTLRSSLKTNPPPPASDPIRPLSPAEDLVPISPVELEPPQFPRMSVASDATTGTLKQYLARRQLHQKSMERSLKQNGMSILAYEREGSWLVTSGSCPYDCPYPECEAHHGRNSQRISRPRRLCNQRPRRPVPTVPED